MRSLLVSLVALTSLGCASIVSKSSYTVLVESTPPGADIRIRNRGGLVQYQGKAPITLSLKASDGYFRSAGYVVEASMPGHTNATASMDATMDPWFVGNILFGGLIGFLIVDPATGAMWRLDERVVVALSEQPSEAASVDGEGNSPEIPKP